MTISATYSPDTYAGDDSTDTFAITFSFLGVSTNVKVSIKVDSTGVITTKTAATHYNVSGSNVVFTAGNIPASGETIIIELNPDFKQTSDYAENAALPAETLETDLDERTLESQYLNELVANSVKVDSATAANMTSTTIVTSSTAATNADKYIKFNSDGDGFEVQTLSTTSGLGNIVEDTSPQLGGQLDVNGQAIGDGTRELLTFTEDASAVNHINIENEATGSGPVVQAAGDDTNIDLVLKPKGSGEIKITGASIEMDDAEGIKDSNGNEQMIFQETASAINHVEITNAAAGSEPRVAGVGDDANVSLELAGKGTGTVNIVGNATQSGVLRIYEDTDQGSAYVGLTVPSNTSTPSVTYSLPDGDGSNGDVLQTDGSGVMSWTTPSTVSAASQAEQETGASTSVYVSPGRQQYHQSAAKAWYNYDQTGPTINASYNIASITDSSAGDYSPQIATDMSSANYSVNVTLDNVSGGHNATSALTLAVGSFRVFTHKGTTLTDSTSYGVLFGDQ